MSRPSRLCLGFLALVAHSTSQVRGQCQPQWLPGEWLPGLDGQALALIVYDDGTGPALYAGGFFAVAGDALASNIVRWDGSAWAPLGMGMNDGVRALAVFNNELIAGGDF